MKRAYSAPSVSFVIFDYKEQIAASGSYQCGTYYKNSTNSAAGSWMVDDCCKLEQVNKNQ